MMVTIYAGRQLTVGEPSHRGPVPRAESRRPIAPTISAESWEQVDQIDFGEAFTTRVPMLRLCSWFFRGRLRFSLGVALRARSRAKLARDPVAETQAWKLFGLIPMLLFHRPRHSSIVVRDDLAQRADDFARGLWRELWTAAREHPNHGFWHQADEDEHSRRGAAAQSPVERGHVSRVRHELTCAPLAPQTMATLSELRARRPQESSSPIPCEVLDFAPQSPVSLDGTLFAKCLRTSPSGSSPGQGGCKNKMLRCASTTQSCWICLVPPRKISPERERQCQVKSCGRSCCFP